MELKLVSDKHRKARGGHSRFFDVRCESCGTHVAFYQKDGPGPLKRMYLDRIVESDVRRARSLNCLKCGQVLGIRHTYKKEKRACFRLFEGAVAKRIVASK